MPEQHQQPDDIIKQHKMTVIGTDRHGRIFKQTAYFIATCWDDVNQLIPDIYESIGILKWRPTKTRLMPASTKQKQQYESQGPFCEHTEPLRQNLGYEKDYRLAGSAVGGVGFLLVLAVLPDLCAGITPLLLFGLFASFITYDYSRLASQLALVFIALYALGLLLITPDILFNPQALPDSGFPNHLINRIILLITIVWTLATTALLSRLLWRARKLKQNALTENERI